MRHLLGLAALAAMAALPAAADVTRNHRLELSGDAASGFTVENLSGRMTVRQGGGKVVVTATVHGEDQALVDSVRLVQDRGEDGKTRLLVKYPVDRHTSYRTPGRAETGSGGWGWIASLFGGISSSHMKYDGHRVSVGGSGVLLWADVQVEVPADSLATFRNHVGAISATGTRGRLRFDSGSGDVSLDGVSGTIAADTGSGDVTSRNGAGTFSCDTGSGDCLVEGFKGEHVDCDTGSGDVRIQADGAREVTADTGSGDVTVSIAGGAVRKVKADTGSGDVILALDRDASFRVQADIGSGDIVSRYADARPIMKGREVVGYTRGDGRTVIDVDTGSGDVVLEPR